jgi:hypothetical protein
MNRPLLEALSLATADLTLRHGPAIAARAVRCLVTDPAIAPDDVIRAAILVLRERNAHDAASALASERWAADERAAS